MPSLTAVFVIDPPERLDPPTDTSLALMREHLRRGHEVLYCTPADLWLIGSRPMAELRPVTFPPGQVLFAAGPARSTDLSGIDLLYMRKDPPVDEAYLHATFILDFLPERVVQVNPSAALRDFCEKLLPLRLPGLMPETVVTCSPRELDAFLQATGRIVVKPLEECSGRGVFSLTPDDPNRHPLFEQITAGGRRFVQAQRFLPEIAEGDVRVLLLAGEPVGWVRRVPAAGDFRSNINAGGRCVPCDLSDRERAICARFGPWLRQEGIVLAGVDIVGDFVLEVNITSPSCLVEINDLTGATLERRIVDHAASACRRFRR